MKRLTSLIAASALAALTLSVSASMKGGERLLALSSKAKVTAGAPAGANVDHAAFDCSKCDMPEEVKAAVKAAAQKLKTSCPPVAPCCIVK